MKRKKNRFLFVLLFVILFPLILVELFFKAVIKLFRKARNRNKKFNDKEFYENLEIEKVDIMDGIAFEQFLKRLFIYLGYQVSETARTGDYGADLVLKRNGETTVVQAKRYSANVGAKAVQEVFSARHHYKADKMMIVSNAHFTRQAEIMAEEQEIELVDREELIALLEEVKKEIQDNFSKDIETELAQDEEVMVLDNFKYRI